MEGFGLMKNGTIRLPTGFRFQPTDAELIAHYLKHKIQSIPLSYPIPEADVCTSDPWSLPGDPEQERYFFSPVDTNYPSAKRTSRTTPSGHWRASGVDRPVVDSRNKHVGTKKTFVFYRSKSANRSKTNWIMHEYKVDNPTKGLQNWVICRVFMKEKQKKDTTEDAEVVHVRNAGTIFYGTRNLDLNVDGGSLSSTASS